MKTRFAVSLSTNPANIAHAIETSRRFAQAARADGSGVVFLVEVTGDRNAPVLNKALAEMRSHWPAGKFLFFDDKNCGDLINGLPAGLAHGLGPHFSFGKGVIIKNWMALEAGCTIRFNVDPGTAPIDGVSLSAMIAAPLAELNTRPDLLIVSGCYGDGKVEKRLAFRTDHLRRGLPTDFLEVDPATLAGVVGLMKKYVGINIREQLTAGASIWNLAGPEFGLPGLITRPFTPAAGGAAQAALAYGLDDVIYQREFLLRTKVIKTFHVDRFAPVSQPRPADQHYRTVVGQVFYSALAGGADRAGAEQAATNFINDFNKGGFLDPKLELNKTLSIVNGIPALPAFNDPAFIPPDYLSSIEDAHRRWPTAKAQWADVVHAALPAMRSDKGRLDNNL